ncbi:MAG: hypothetical protein AAF562_14140 [Pseudomonadota bacterium]
MLTQVKHSGFEAIVSIKDKTLVFRADGGGHRGIGHLMRCLALAEAAAALGGRTSLWTEACPPPVAALYRDRGIPIERPSSRADWLIVDSYDITSEMRDSLRTSAQRMLVIDDVGDNGPYEADLLVNPNLGASEPGFLAGSDYIFLRQDVLSAKTKRSFGPVKHILISCGGSDPAQANPSVLHALRGLPTDVEVRLLTGVDVSPEAAPNVECVSASFDIAAHLNWADLAILAAGTVQWEAAYLGCPFIPLIIADNQKPGTDAFANQVGFEALDWRSEHHIQALANAVTALMALPEERQRRAYIGQHIIDGQGCQRMLAAIAQIA